MDPCILEESSEEKSILNFDDDIVKFVELCSLRWAGHVMRMSENGPTKKVVMLEPGGR
jgi:hypothetical protein